MRILVVEDDAAIAKPIRRALERERFSVSVCDTGHEALRLIRTWDPDIVLLDLFLPDRDGLDLMRDIGNASRPSVIMVSARGEERDRVAGLDAGADDYIVKPFSVSELLARIRAVRRRHTAIPESPQRLIVGDITIDDEAGSVAREGNDVDLTRTEYELLRILVKRRGSVVTRAELVRAVWNASPDEVRNTLDVHMSALRRKLGDDPRAPKLIATVRGTGFRFIG